MSAPAQAVTIGVVAAVGAGLAALGIAAADGREGYPSAARAQRLAVTRAIGVVPPVTTPGERVLCARSVATFASAAATLVDPALRRSDRTVDLTALSWVVHATFEADRWSELAMGAPGIPQRAGTSDVATQVTREQCDGRVAFAQAQIALPGGSVPVKATSGAARSR